MGCSVCPHTSVRLQRAQPLHKGMPITHAPHCPLSAKSPAVFGDACVRARLRACHHLLWGTAQSQVLRKRG